jgi:ATP-dependent Clp protease adapter protein ClpS
MPDINASHLPQKPDLAQERKRAKDLFKALRTGDGEAIARFRSHHPSFADSAPHALRGAHVQLSDAQWVIAREYGFPSWPSLKAYIEQVAGRAENGTAPYSILMWNDDATPMEFVVHVLKDIFQKSDEEAVQIVLDTDQNGVGVCAVYKRLDDAEAKVTEARNLARRHGHPLELTYAFGDAAKKGKPTRPLEKELGEARAELVRLDETNMHVELIDGRTLSVPLAWFPKLMSASADQRRRYALSDQGRILSWSELGLVVSVSGLLVGPEGQTAGRRAISPPRSVEACRAALDELSRQRAPLEWAKAQNDLGNALQFASVGPEGSTTLLEEAIAAHRAALEEYSRERAPVEWAATQSYLGHALFALGRRDAGAARMEEAVAAYRAAATEATRVPLQQWVSTQDKLGSALFTLGTRESGIGRLEEAIAAFGKVLTDRTRERLPFDWALSTGKQGVAFMLLSASVMHARPKLRRRRSASLLMLCLRAVMSK